MIDIGVARPRAQGQAMIRTATALTSPKPMAGAGPGLAGATRRRLSERQVQGLEALFALRAIAQQVDDVPTGCGHGGSNPNPRPAGPTASTNVGSGGLPIRSFSEVWRDNRVT